MFMCEKKKIVQTDYYRSNSINFSFILETWNSKQWNYWTQRFSNLYAKWELVKSEKSSICFIFLVVEKHTTSSHNWFPLLRKLHWYGPIQFSRYDTYTAVMIKLLKQLKKHNVNWMKDK